MSEIVLPTTLESLKACFGNTDRQVLSTLRNANAMTDSTAAIWKYSGGALITGRPLDSTIIMMAGQSGAGKSSTINTLFNDQTLCKVSDTESSTREIVLVQKSLAISKETPTLRTTMSFVDVPGIFDTNVKNDAVNLEIIKRFKSTRVELVNRESIPSVFRKFYKIPKSVYPNLVLFVIRADDDRMGGPDSQFRKSLQVFKEMENLIDFNKNNLIVVLTFAMSMTKKHFEARFKKRKEIIQRGFREMLQIAEVEIVPVENEPEEYNLPELGDYYKLPNGDWSPLNLFEAMNRRFAENKDLLARVSIAWYYDTECPDREKKAQVIETNIKLEEAELQKLRNLSVQSLPLNQHEEVPQQLESADVQILTIQEVDNLPARSSPTNQPPPQPQLVETNDSEEETMSTSSSNQDELEYLKELQMELPRQMYNMQCLGNGFCPVTEQIKTVFPLKATGNPRKIELGGSQFQLPPGMSAFANHASKFYRLSFLRKEQYEQHMQTIYGLEAGVKLTVSASLEGKWVEQTNFTEEHAWISVVHETQVATLSLNDPCGQLKSERFQLAIDNLPDEFNETTMADFRSFFSRWGTHLVHDLALGGCVQLKCMIKKKNMTEKKFNSVAINILGAFKEIFTVTPTTSFAKSVKNLRSQGIVEESLQFIGGRPPDIVTLDSLDTSILHKWASTVSTMPAELRHTAKLYPYYNLVEGDKSRVLQQATEDYLASGGRREFYTARELNQNQIARETLDDAFESSSQGGKCFPKGANILLYDGSNIRIENLSPKQHHLLSLKMRGTGNSKMVKGVIKTKFCAYLHAVNECKTMYICLRFSNKKLLLVSPGHMIFEYLSSSNKVVGKQAKHMTVGDKSICLVNRVVEYPTVIGITQEVHEGAYCPLTTTGTFVVDGFFVSCYAHIDSFQLGQYAMAPLKLYKQIFGCKSMHKKNKEEIHPYAKSLIIIGEYFKFKIL